LPTSFIVKILNNPPISFANLHTTEKEEKEKEKGREKEDFSAILGETDGSGAYSLTERGFC
jgi:hypothetical protein